MSRKQWEKLNPLDRKIRRGLSDLGMASTDTYLKIEYIYGFELFNTRAYHCYEMWCGGYRVTDDRREITVVSEDLDDAIEKWARQVAEKVPEMADHGPQDHSRSTGVADRNRDVNHWLRTDECQRLLDADAITPQDKLVRAFEAGQEYERKRIAEALSTRRADEIASL